MYFAAAGRSPEDHDAHALDSTAGGCWVLSGCAVGAAIRWLVLEQVRGPRDGARRPASRRQSTDAEYGKPTARDDPPCRLACRGEANGQWAGQSRVEHRADHGDAECRADLAARCSTRD